MDMDKIDLSFDMEEASPKRGKKRGYRGYRSISS